MYIHGMYWYVTKPCKTIGGNTMYLHNSRYVCTYTHCEQSDFLQNIRICIS